MKQLLIAALFLVTAGSSAFAADTKSVTLKARYNFEHQFAGAKNVQWSITENYFSAKFTYVDEPVEAFFSTDGEFIGSSRKIDLKSLPLNALQTIRKKYAAFKVMEAIEFDRGDEKSYYLSLENSTGKQILEVSLYGEVTRFK